MPESVLSVDYAKVARTLLMNVGVPFPPVRTDREMITVWYLFSSLDLIRDCLKGCHCNNISSFATGYLFF